MERIPVDRFAEFHRIFRNEDSEFSEICAECGGDCEQSAFPTLLPGEKEFIARSLNCSVTTFENKYLDTVVIPGGELYVTKFNVVCPALDRQQRCIFRNVKPVDCKLYPLQLAESKGKIAYQIDNECPASRVSVVVNRLKRKFEECIPLLGISPAWIKALSKFWYEEYDRRKLSQLRKLPDRCERFELKEVLKCRA